jgi:tetratricopeptide (TPR) repeat protein
MARSQPQHLFSLLLLFGATPLWPAASWAAEASAPEISVARRLFDEGKVAEDAGRFREAAEKFRKAVAIKDTPGMRFHLARCEEGQGAFVEALLEYDRARELLDSGVKAVDVEKLLPDARERVRAKLSQLTLRLPEGIANARIELDDKPLSDSVVGTALPVNPGKHRLRASAPGRQSYAGELELTQGESKQIVIELPLVPAVPTPVPAATGAVSGGTRPASAADSPTPWRTVALAGEASLFAVALTSGIVFTVAKSAAEDRYQTANERVLSQFGGADPMGIACAEQLEGCAELEEARQDRGRDAKLATAGFVVAGASAVAFGLTLVLWKDDPPARVGASLGPGRAALSVSGSF